MLLILQTENLSFKQMLYSFISKINNTFTHSAEDLDIVMPTYNLLVSK